MNIRKAFYDSLYDWLEYYNTFLQIAGANPYRPNQWEYRLLHYAPGMDE